MTILLFQGMLQYNRSFVLNSHEQLSQVVFLQFPVFGNQDGLKSTQLNKLCLPDYQFYNILINADNLTDYLHYTIQPVYRYDRRVICHFSLVDEFNH